MCLLSVCKMDLEDVESTESFYFLLKPLCSSVLPYVHFFFFLSLLTDRFGGLEGQWC